MTKCKLLIATPLFVGLSDHVHLRRRQCVCLSTCLSVWITQKVMNGFWRNFTEGWTVVQGPNSQILVAVWFMIRISRDQDSPILIWLLCEQQLYWVRCVHQVAARFLVGVSAVPAFVFYTVSQKHHPFYFCDIFVRFHPILLSFGRNIPPGNWKQTDVHAQFKFFVCVCTLPSEN